MRSILRIILFIFIIALVALLFLFFGDNSQSIQVKFLNWNSAQHPLATSLMLAFCAGFAVSTLFFLFEVIKCKAQLMQARKLNKQLKKEIDQIRNEPISNPGKVIELQEKSTEDTLSGKSWSAALETSPENSKNDA